MMQIHITYTQSTGIIRVVSTDALVFSEAFDIDEALYFDLLQRPDKYIIQDSLIVDAPEPEIEEIII